MLEKTKRLKDTANYTHLEKFWKFIESWDGENNLVEQFLPRWKNATRLVEEPLSIAVMGEFNAGKSSFINALLGKEKFLPVSVIPKTATISILKYGEEESVEIFFTDNSKEYRQGYEYLGKISKASKIIDEELYAKEISRIERIEISCNSHYLKHFKIIDTPGFNHENLMDEKANSVLDQVDLVIWLFQGRQAGTTTEIEKIKEIKELGKPIYIILNKIDSVEESERSYILEQLSSISKNICCNEDGKIFGVCSNPGKINSNKEYEYLFKDLQNELDKVFFNNDYEISHSHLGKLRSDLGTYISEELNTLKKLTQGIDILTEKIHIEHDKYTNQSGEIIKSIDNQAEKLITNFASILSDHAINDSNEQKSYSKELNIQDSYCSEYLNFLRGHDALNKAMLEHCKYLREIFSKNNTSIIQKILSQIQNNTATQSKFYIVKIKKIKDSVDSFTGITDFYCTNFLKSEIYGFLAGVIGSEIFTTALRLAQELPQQKSSFLSFFGKKPEETSLNAQLTVKLTRHLNTLAYININRDYFDYNPTFQCIKSNTEQTKKTLLNYCEALSNALNILT